CAEADIGTNATILPVVTIGKGAIVGAGAVVVSDVEPFSLADIGKATGHTVDRAGLFVLRFE
ncbi:hypothetical protein ACC703_39360, partial [Rhizobium ruizarguesonis]